MDSFSRIERKSVSDQVFEMLKEHIIQGKWKAGDKVPSENELSRMLGCSRPPIKAAVERLRAMGLIEVRVGDGSYVKSFTTSDYIDNYADFIMDEANIRELIEFRSALELASLPYVLTRAKPEEIAKLEVLAKDLADAYGRKDYDAGAVCDFDFHLQLCRCSGNSYFTNMYQLVGNLIFRQIANRGNKLHKQNERAFLFDDHIHIYEAIIAGDLAKSQDLLETHILNRDNHLEKLASLI